MKKLFHIGDFQFQIEYPDSLRIPEHFLLFEAPGSVPEYFYKITEVPSLPKPQGRRLAQREDLTVYLSDGREARKLSMRGKQEYYACYEEISPCEALVSIRLGADGNPESPFWLDTTFTALFALERRISFRGFLLLHCAFLCDRDRAILFSGPSGVGKSTQAKLWQKYRCSSIVNGDRALLGKNGAGWHAYGWPVCGSSEICHNQTMPVRAIVMLGQGNTNRIRLLAPIEAFAELYGQITVNRWDGRSVERAADRLEDLVNRIPVYHLDCTVSEEAVDCLEQALQTKI